MGGKIKIGEVAVCQVPVHDENYWSTNPKEIFSK